MPPAFVTLAENVIEQNPVQLWLWQCYQDALKELPRKLDAVVIVGDATEGLHHGSEDVISTDWMDHRDCAIAALRPLTSRAKHVFATLGTACHTQSIEHAVAKACGAKQINHSRYAHDVLYLECAGHLANFQHHCSPTSRPWLESNE